MSTTSAPPRLQDQFRAVIRLHHYSIRTEKSYWYWIRYFIRFHKLRHPLEMGPAEVNAFLSWLAVDRDVGGHAKPGAEYNRLSLCPGAR
ncbi:phage integrase N-terminal SAM-like domain-containing protein [Pseudomonas sp. OIL-1]|uniref:phage integrase N-terminal SAM-like domain-containing protein n=1 Tax=Pseudomonas sp. OIL-1 TaxID=2706126 RepID=UPI00211593AF|nr:phage integrase N-terminal SAM-like domain-containing protein [Pseudomonas sp. OIL-1]